MVQPWTGFRGSGHVFAEALRRTEAACRSEGLTRHWRAFEARVYHPAVHECEPLMTEDLIEELGARDAQDVYDMTCTVKRKLCHALQDVVAETVEDVDDVEGELAAIRRLLSA